MHDAVFFRHALQLLVDEREQNRSSEVWDLEAENEVLQREFDTWSNVWGKL